MHYGDKPKSITRTLRSHRGASIDGFPCGDVSSYLLHLSLSDVADPTLRARLQQIPTGLTIPASDVDSLVSAGEILVRDSKILARFGAELTVPTQ